ncbi:MAG: hypothetical protein LQ342_006410 [Letrouitia transgressa]|nr:MAG: hypothetical protein LQ342_006410 [Letrouitia transgressa]
MRRTPLSWVNRRDDSRTLTITNQCPEVIYPGIGTQAGTGPAITGFKLAKDESRDLTVSADWQGRVWGRTNCSFNAAGTGPASSGTGVACGSGDCGGVINCRGTGVVPVTLAEFTLASSSGQTFYDISLVDGYNIPVGIIALDTNVPPNMANPICVGTASLLAEASSALGSDFGTNSSFPIPLDSFLILPTAFPNSKHSGVSKKNSGIIAGLLLAIGYILSAVLRIFCKSWLFQFDVIYIPCLSSSVLGLFNVLYSLGTQPGNKGKWNKASIAAIVLSTISSVSYLVLSLVMFRKIYIVRTRDAMHRHHSTDESINLLPEDEMQRQQLLRLLLQRENGKKLSPDLSQSTFRIDLPDSLRRNETHLTAPQNIYGNHSRGRSVPPAGPYLSPSTQYTPVQAQENPSLSESPFDPYQSPPSESSHTQHYISSDFGGPPPLTSTGYPAEKAEETAHLDGEVHPLEREDMRARPQYHVVEEVELKRQRSTSRESRRAEIELERGVDEGRRAELEGVKISPRIQRVETDGWGGR